MWSAADKTGQGQGGSLQAGWVRRRYFIRDGYIRPIQGSEVVRYDPFESYYGTDAARVGRSLYLEMIDLNEQDERAVEDFVSTWGLLGLFQHRLVQARHVDSPIPDFARRRTAPPNLLETFEDFTGSMEFEFTNETDPWRMGFQKNFRQWLSSTRFPNGSVIIYNRYGLLEEVSRTDFYSRYFPELPKAGAAPVLRPYIDEMTEDDLPSYRELVTMGDALEYDRGWDYPRLHVPELWDHLCEPLHDFRVAVGELGELYDLCAFVSSTPPVPEPPPDAPDSAWELVFEDRNRRHQLEIALSQALRRVHPVPRLSQDGTRWSWGWSFPSLLSAAYAMLFLDFIVEGRKLRFCANETCGKTFVTERSDRKYCSERCQNAAKQREFRRARKAAATDPQKGETK